MVLIPVFILAHRLLPDTEWPFHLDRILLLVCAIAVIEIILQTFRKAILRLLMLSVLALALGSVFGSYGFKTLFTDYRDLFYSVHHDPHPEKLLVKKLSPFPNKAEVKSAMDFNKEIVRNFALTATSNYFVDEARSEPQLRVVIQSLAIFKEIN